MKRLNIKLLLVSLVVVIVFGVGVFAVHAYQMSRSSDSLLKRAESAKTSGNMPQALWYYRRYLSYNPTDLQRGAGMRIGCRRRCRKRRQLGIG